MDWKDLPDTITVLGQECPIRERSSTFSCYTNDEEWEENVIIWVYYSNMNQKEKRWRGDVSIRSPKVSKKTYPVDLFDDVSKSFETLDELETWLHDVLIGYHNEIQKLMLAYQEKSGCHKQLKKKKSLSCVNAATMIPIMTAVFASLSRFL